MAASIPIPDQLAVSMGEILWDQLGNERHLGGAPLNFAYHCQALGAKSAVISSISSDDLGADLLHKANSLQVDCTGISRDSQYSTGLVQAEVAGDGTVTYNFPAECAWDHIHFTDNARRLVDEASIFNYGTLAQRSPVSRSAIGAALASLPVKTLSFLDLNLRVPYYDRETIHRSLDCAHVVKMNAWELAEVKSLLDLSGTNEATIRQLMDKYDLRAVVVTLGCDGAFACDRDGSASVEGFDVDVVDTIGCGDAFGAAFITYLVSGCSLQESLEIGNAAGGFVAGTKGATPQYSAKDLETFRTGHPRPMRTGA